jgi:hypothetical protein
MTVKFQNTPYRAGDFLSREDEKAGRRYTCSWYMVNAPVGGASLPAGYPFIGAALATGAGGAYTGFLMFPKIFPPGGEAQRCCVLERGHNVIDFQALPTVSYNGTVFNVANMHTRIAALGFLERQEPTQSDMSQFESGTPYA